MIGLFDSGSGGLTVLREIRRALPSVDVLYFGDTKHAPYGLRSRADLTRLTVAAIQFLQAGGVRSIVSACNSVSASLAVATSDSLLSADTQLVEMVGPTAAHFNGSTARVLVCATPATIDSGVYQNAFSMLGKDVAVLPIPELAGAIESGAPKAEITGIVRTAFPQALLEEVDVVVLACTHYPLVLDSFREVLGDHVLFDPAVAVARRVEVLFGSQEVGEGKTRFVITKEAPPFRAQVARLFPGEESFIEVL